MKNRKVMAATLAAALLVSLSGTALADHCNTVGGAVYGCSHETAASNEQVREKLSTAGVTNLDEVARNYAAGSISVLVEAGVYRPDSNGNIKPEAKLNAGSGVAVFAKILGVASKTADDAAALAAAQDAGLVDREVTADKPLTRMETARMLAKALGVTPRPSVGQFPFADSQGLSLDDMRLLGALYDLGIFKGFPDGTFKPGDVLDVAQLAILIDRILGAH